MEEIIAIIIEYTSIWAPSLAAIFGVAVMALTATKKSKEYFEQFKSDESIQAIKEDLKKVVAENKELKRNIELLLDNINKIKGYSDAKKKGE